MDQNSFRQLIREEVENALQAQRCIVRDEMLIVLHTYFADNATPDDPKRKRGRPRELDNYDPNIPYRENYNEAAKKYYRACRETPADLDYLEVLRNDMKRKYTLLQKLLRHGYPV